MADYSRLLQLLADGEIHSGEELSELLGVSRTAIWKQLKKLQGSTGLCVESIKGKGYCLGGGIELLDSARVISRLSDSGRCLLAELSVHGQVGSTNTIALRHAEEGAKSGYVVVAEQQLAGRGRRGRKWVSPYGCNIYCSSIWRFQGGAAALEGLSLVVGVAVARALAAVGVEGVKLKWPNDVLWGGGKLAGILLEMTGDASGHCQVVIGIGINISMAKNSTTADIDQPWTDVSTAVGCLVSRNRVLSSLLSELLPMLAEFEGKGFIAFRQEWISLDSMAGRAVCLHLGERVIVGHAAGVGDNGALALDTEVGRQWFHGGEVSLRLQDG